MGGPGAGKGTQCKKLLKKHSYLDSYSTGDLLRAKVKEGTEDSKDLQERMKRGELITSDYVTGLMKTYMGRRCDTKVFLADGFPRNKENLEAWDKNLGKHVDTEFLMLFGLKDETMLSRLRGRAEKTPVEKRRADDNEETYKKRIATFHQHEKAFDRFKEMHNGFVEIDADRDVDTIHEDVLNTFKNRGLLEGGYRTYDSSKVDKPYPCKD